MTKETISEELTAIFRDVFDDDALVTTDDTVADDVENWNSLTHIDMIVAVEKHFKVRFTTGEVTGLKNVGDLKALIAEKTPLVAR